MKIFNIIMVIFVIGFHVVFPITLAIKESIDKSNGNKWNIKVFFEKMLYVIFPFLFIAVFIILFAVFTMIFKNYGVAGILTIAISIVGLKFLDR